MPYGWIDDPVPIEWPEELRFQYGEVVRINGVEMLDGRQGIVFSHDSLGNGDALRYGVAISGEPVSWFLEERFLESTGAIADKLPRRFRPVLGDETVVRLLNAPETREKGIVGKLALTEGLWWVSDSEEPKGYTVRLPGDRRVYSVPFGVFEVVEGSITDVDSI